MVPYRNAYGKKPGTGGFWEESGEISTAYGREIHQDCSRDGGVGAQIQVVGFVTRRPNRLQDPVPDCGADPRRQF